MTDATDTQRGMAACGYLQLVEVEVASNSELTMGMMS
jgi:hypothetical protein